MKGKTPNGRECVIPVKNSVLYNTILKCANGRWQKNKILTLVQKGYVSGLFPTGKGYDYEGSLARVTDRIQEALKDSDMYHLEYIQISDDPVYKGYVLVRNRKYE